MIRIMFDNRESGFSLTEMAAAIMVGIIMAAIAIPVLNSTIKQSNAESAAQLIIQELNYARAVAVGSHTPVQVQFPDADQIVVAAGTGEMRGPFVLPNGIRILDLAPNPDTPDGLGGTRLGIEENNTLWFLDNGAVVDNLVNNNLRSGTFFLQHKDGDPTTRRAVTLLGGTGRTHSWRYDTSENNWK
jgi:Tfp pilus assembly protein FimT